MRVVEQKSGWQQHWAVLATEILPKVRVGRPSSSTDCHAVRHSLWRDHSNIAQLCSEETEIWAISHKGQLDPDTSFDEQWIDTMIRSVSSRDLTWNYRPLILVLSDDLIRKIFSTATEHCLSLIRASAFPMNPDSSFSRSTFLWVLHPFFSRRKN